MAVLYLEVKRLGCLLRSAIHQPFRYARASLIGREIAGLVPKIGKVPRAIE